ncbi:MAG TPA: MarR family transcriptional regulator [Cytophagales bacterium]|nr:MarR family transcriptional regulator [Cytophagales bacterium]
MKLSEAKQEFLQTWGKLGSEWGINRTMAQVHALLLISPKPLSTEDIMEELSISRGNANMNLRELVTWDLIEKVLVPGERKEYFSAEKDMWEIAKRVAKERKKREIEPVLKVLKRLEQVEGTADESAEVKEFRTRIAELNDFVTKMDKSVDTMLKAEENWFFGTIIKMIR